MATRAHSGGGDDPALSVWFGPFELDLRGGELRKHGHRVRLQEQPFQILRMLLESPGDVISRENIQKRLWPDNTVVEFDHSINTAVKRLRDVLRDSADKPRYIETVARRGYRFIGEVDTTTHHATLAEPVAAPPNELTITRAEPTPQRSQIYRRPLIPVLLLATIILVVWAGVEYTRRRGQPVAAPLQPLMRLDLDLGDETQPGSELGARAILSPDGRRLVYVSRSKLFNRALDQPNATELSGTDNSQAPFFSPDGQWVAFFAGGKLRKISSGGGPVIELCEAPLGGGGGGSWGEDGYIVVAVNYVIERIPSAGGVPMPITQLTQGEIVHRWPQVLPGGKAVIFSSYASMSGLDGANIEVISLEKRRRSTVVRGGTWGRYLPSGHLVYISKGTLFAVPFDPIRLEVRGTPTPVLEDVAYNAAWGSAQIDFSRTGTLVYRDGRAGGGLVTIQWVDESGNTSPLLPVPGNYLSPALSVDGNRLAFTSGGDIWVYDLKQSAMTRLTFGGGYGNPLWTTDGQYVVFRAAGGIFWIRAAGTDRPKPLTQGNNPQLPWSFTPDGKLAFVEIDPATGADIWTIPVETDGSGLRAGKPEVFLQSPFQERCPMFSPDGRWLAYMSNESGAYQVYVQAFPHKGGKQQVSTDSGGYPAWSRDGKDLFFSSIPVSHGQLMAVSYQSRGDSFETNRPRIWSRHLAGFGTTRSYDPVPGGKRIVALTAADSAQESHDRVVFLLNFFDELRRRLPLSAN